MCTPYSLSFTCMKCCKSFKKSYQIAPNDYPEHIPCTECGGLAWNFGRHFRPPKKTNKKQWEKIRFLFDHGFRFQKIRLINSTESFPYPKTLKEAKEFVVKYKEYARFSD